MSTAKMTAMANLMTVVLRIWLNRLLTMARLAAAKPGRAGRTAAHCNPALVERHADPLLPAPDDVARFAQPLARDLQREMLGKPERCDHFQRRPRRGNVADGAGNRRCAEHDRSGFQYAAARGDPVLVHDRAKRKARF